MRGRLFLLFLALLGSALPPAQAATAQPNIVLLLADDWGFTDVGAYGSEIATPNIDALAARGLRFANFHVAASCAPTRAMLLSGVDNHRNGVGNMPETMPPEHVGEPGYAGILDTEVVTLAEMLRDNGYHTYISGKWHLGKTAAKLPNRRGFERSFIQADSGSDNWQQRPYMLLYDQAYWFEDDRAATLPEDFYSSQLIVDKAIDYIDSNRADGQPFFAYLGFQANHIPLQAPQANIDKYRGAYAGGWQALRQARRARAVELGLVPADSAMLEMASTQDWAAQSPEQRARAERSMEVYAGMADAMDEQIGRLIAHLKASGEYANTVFVFMSDNGPEPSDPLAIWTARLWLAANYSTDLAHLGAKGTYAVLGPSWASAAAAPLSGYKFFAGEGGLRVPLIIAGVPGMPNNGLSQAFTHVTDLMPTLLELAGIAPHDGHYRGRTAPAMTGRSLLPLLMGQAAQVHPAEQAIGYELAGNAALFKGPYKLLKNLLPIGDGQWHLYNLERDPGETTDLREAMPALFAQLQGDYAAYAKANGVLVMPKGYDHLLQIQWFSLEHGVLLSLIAWLPYVLALMAVLGGGFYWRRSTRSKA